MAGWNFADVWEAIADAQPDAPAQVHGAQRATWADFDGRADGLALALLDRAGLEQGDKVATYLYNCPEYMELSYAAMKVGAVPVNTNYRYREDELAYLWDNADAVAVAFHGAFADRVDGVRGRVPRVALWLWVDDGSGPCPRWAVPYEEAAAPPEARVIAPWGRSEDDLIFIYTGGTTGMPKGVMWRHDDLYRLSNIADHPDDADLDAVVGSLHRSAHAGIPACPLMHGTGFLIALSVLSAGGCNVTLDNHKLDVPGLFDAVEREGVARLGIVGDAFGRPMLAALDEHPGRWDLSCLRILISSGAMFSEPVKKGILGHLSDLLIADLLGSSEALGVGASISGGNGTKETARFRPGKGTRVVTDDGRLVEPGSGEVGMLAVGGPTSLGYYKDVDKTERTFRVVDGARYLVPGDFATLEADGSIRLLGRGSVCINTGGEKVFPEEVEEALKVHPGVADAVVVGIPDERFGQAICAVVELVDGAATDEDALVAHVKARLAGYKAPRLVWIRDSVGRSPNGKADYPGLTKEASERFGA